MNERILPREEWSKLDVTGFPAIGSTLRPEDSKVTVIEEAGEIVASLGTFRFTHFESLWIAPKYRGNPAVARKLMRAGAKAAREWTDQWVWGCSGTEHMNDILERLGGRRMPVETFILSIDGEPV